MGAKSKYVIVLLKSVLSGSRRVWVRDRAGEPISKILHDPALGMEVLFEEASHVKGKTDLPEYVKKKYELE